MMGAEVIKVGSVRRPDPSSRGAPFQAYNQSKLYVALNIAKPEGLALAKRLTRHLGRDGREFRRWRH